MEDNRNTIEELERRCRVAEAKAERLAGIEVREAHIKKVLLAIRNVNQLIVQEDDPIRLIEQACASLTETLGYHNAWIALLDEESKTAVAMAASGFGAEFEALGRRLSRGEFPVCMKRALNSAETIVVEKPKTHCPDCPLSREYGGYAGLSRRLAFGGTSFGILAVSVPASFASDAEEQSLFGEMAGDLAFALHKIGLASRVRESEEKYRIIANYTAAWESWFAQDGKYLWVNPGVEHFTGYSPGEILAMPDFAGTLIAEEDRGVYAQWFREALGGSNGEDFEFRYIRKDGSTRWLSVVWRTLHDEKGAFIGVRSSGRDITERKQSEQVLREEHLRLEFTIDGARLGTWEWNIRTNKTAFSETWARMLGYTVEELEPYDYGTWVRLVHPEDIARAVRQLTLCIEDETPDYQCEYRMKHKDGDWVWILDCGRVMTRDAAGKPLSMFGTHADITGIKRREERIALLGQMLDEAPASITIHDSAGRFLFANRRTLLLHGYDCEEEFLAVNLHDLDLPESKELLAERFRLIAEEGEAAFEVAHYRKDGSTFPLQVFAKKIQLHDQPAILSVAADITERKQAEQALRRSEEKYRVLFNTFPAGITISDPSGNILESNARASEILGIPKDEHEARRIDGDQWRIIRPDGTTMPAGEYASIRALKEKRLVKNVEMGIVNPDAGITWLNVTAAPLLLENFGVVITYNDITERKRAEAEKAILEAQLLQAQKMESVGRLAGGVAHDSNNMLGVILGHVEMALEQVDPAQPLFADLQEVRKAAERSADLTRQLLTFARKQTIAPKVIDLNETVEGMLKMLRRLIGENMDLLWKPGRDLRPVKVDPSQIDQLLANLCINARDAIKGVGKITIETDAAAFDEAYCADHAGFVPGEYVLLAVSDDGCGMDQETLGHLFEPFFTTKGAGKGTGLGLATVYGMVKQNNGFINVYSEPGQGTTFKIYLPRHSARTAPLTEKAPGLPAERGHEIILLVEDEPAILKVTTIMLERLGYAVIGAKTPGEAIRLAHENTGRIHLIMTDVVMPEMNGRELAAKLLSFYPGIKRLFMSGYTADVIAHHGVLDEGVHFIQKPFSMAALAAKVREALGAAQEG